MEFSLRVCRYCFKSNDNMKKCSRCQWTYYCNEDCQRTHWSEHRLTCVEIDTNPYKNSDVIVRGISNNVTFQHTLYSVHYLNRKDSKDKIICVNISIREEGGYFCDIIMDYAEEFNMPPDIKDSIKNQIADIKTLNLVALLMYSENEENNDIKIIPLILSYNRKFINKIILRQIRDAGEMPIRIIINN